MNIEFKFKFEDIDMPVNSFGNNDTSNLVINKIFKVHFLMLETFVFNIFTGINFCTFAIFSYMQY